MKRLHQLLTDNIIYDIVDSFWDFNLLPEINGALKAAFINNLIRHSRRLVRPNFTNTAILRMHLINYVQMNKQKLTYLAQTASSEFLEVENSSVNDMVNTQFNTDFQGGTGQTGKGENNLKTISKTKDKREWLLNHQDLSENVIIVGWFNSVCESWEAGWTW